MILDEINRLLAVAEKAIPDTLLPDQPPGKYTSGKPQMYAFEHEIWRSGDDIRLYLSQNKTCKLSEAQQNRIVKIAVNPFAKRGRQSFIMLLGYKKYQQFSGQIISQISDSDVEGHVVDTLLKMQALDYADIIEPFTRHEIAWIRNKAKKYIENYR